MIGSAEIVSHFWRRLMLVAWVRQSWVSCEVQDGGQSKFDKSTNNKCSLSSGATISQSPFLGIAKIYCLPVFLKNIFAHVAVILGCLQHFIRIYFKDHQTYAGGSWCICVGNDCIIPSLSRSQDVPQPLSPPRTVADAHHDTLAILTGRILVC